MTGNADVQAWIADVLQLVPEGTVEQNIFRSQLQAKLSSLLLASDRPSILLGRVIDDEVEAVRESFPDFVPVVSPHLESLPWPDAPSGSLEHDLLEAAAQRYDTVA